MSRSLLTFSVCILLLSGLGAQEKDLAPIYKNSKAAVEDRLADLLSRLTLEEKIDRLIEAKQELAGRLVGAGEAWLTEFSTKELKELFALRQEAIGD